MVLNLKTPDSGFNMRATCIHGCAVQLCVHYWI